MNTPATKGLSWSHGVVSVQTLGGMLGPTVFVLPDGRQIAPLHVAPWAEDGTAGDQPGILRRLRGEWPCVPFGAAGDRDAADGWPASRSADDPDPFPHGYGSNHDWHWIAAPDDELALAIDYPAPHPIARLERRIRPVSGRPAIEIELVVTPRRDCLLPIGLHPVFRLSARPGAMALDVKARAAATFPGDVDPSSIFAPGQMVSDWHAIALRDNTTLDPARLPLDKKTEDLLQLVGAGGTATLTNTDENYQVKLDWDAADFPDLLLWFSNCGRDFPPWNGRHLALGVEPVCAAFDLGAQISGQPNPINAAGSATAHQFRQGQPFRTSYGISVDVT